MAYTRRNFAKLLQTGAIVAVAGFDPTAVMATPRSARSSTRILKGRDFEPLAGSEFRLLQPTGESRTLTLCAVAGKTYPKGGRMTPDVEYFTLRFAGEGSELPAEIHLLEHPSFGQFKMFLSPGLPGRYRATVAHVPEDYMAKISIPRKKLRRVLPSIA